MSDTRARASLDGKAVDLNQLDVELGGFGLCGSADEIVAVEGSPVTVEQLAAAITEHAPRHRPLGPAGVTATLNAVLGVWPLADAANAVRLPAQALVDEATAWAEVAGA